jgi:hypothetical protein
VNKILDYAKPPSPPPIEPKASSIYRIIAGLGAIAVVAFYILAIVNTRMRHGGVEAFKAARRGFAGPAIFGFIMGYRALTGRPFRPRFSFQRKKFRR